MAWKKNWQKINIQKKKKNRCKIDVKNTKEPLVKKVIKKWQKLVLKTKNWRKICIKKTKIGKNWH